jgi:hypothetical protein
VRKYSGGKKKREKSVESPQVGTEFKKRKHIFGETVLKSGDKCGTLKISVEIL